MLFQKVPYNNNEASEKYQDLLFETNEANWDDTWHEGSNNEDGGTNSHF